MTRRQHQQGVAASRRRAEAVERADDDFFLALHGAAREQHGTAWRNAEEPQYAVGPAPRRGSGVERFELEAAGDDDRRRVGAELDETTSGLFSLHTEAVDVPLHTPEERPHQAVAWKRSVGDAAVDQRGLDPAAAAFAQQVGPDLGLDH